MRRVLALILLCSFPAIGQGTAKRFWLAGRYDGNRIIVYFNAVKFGDTLPSNAVELAPPVADAFFTPVALPASYINGLQQGPDAEHFAIGDHYDLLLSGSEAVTVKLTTLVGFQNDEGVGNDSYIGALATLDRASGLELQKNYFAVTRHHDPMNAKAALLSEPVRRDVEIEIALRLNERMKKLAKPDVRLNAAALAPAYKTQSFKLADGSLRYYARAEWRSSATYALGAWLSPTPALHILAVEHQTSPYDFENELPTLLNVLDLGDGKTGIIVGLSGEDSRALSLYEYRDGIPIKNMHRLHSFGSAE